MARTNTPQRRKSQIITTHEGAPAKRIDAEQELRRSVMACLLWESQFYESGESIAGRIADLCERVEPEKIAAIAIEARTKMYLRHVPLWLTRQLANRVSKSGGSLYLTNPDAVEQGEDAKYTDLGPYTGLVASTLNGVIQRADELAEFLALYWKDGKEPLSSQVKKGLAQAFTKFDAYALGKYNRDGAVKLRDVLFLSHAKPKDEEQAAVWQQLVDGTLPAPDTWEVELSAGKDKRATWERLITEKKLGGLAMLRNLRNMQEADVPDAVIKQGLNENRFKRVLPFRFVAAAQYAPKFEPELEQAMFRSLAEMPKLEGKTALVVDHSGSMSPGWSRVSEKSNISRFDAAAALGILIREVCEDCLVVCFSNDAAIVPARRGFALQDAMERSVQWGGTYTEAGKTLADREGYDRIIVITDEQSHQVISGPGEGKSGYFVNVASYQNGIGYGRWTHIDGWSENILRYIQEIECAAV